MKQMINSSQIYELTPEQQVRLKEWYKSGGYLTMPDRDYFPILSIGQCIELLKWPRIHPISDMHHDWVVTTTNKHVYEAKELVDALWKAVKEEALL